MNAADRQRVEDFERERPRLVRLAYATLGTLSEAEDTVQEAWLRAQGTDWSTIQEPAAWLTTVVGRLALDTLGSARVRRERYVGTWLPEPLVDGDLADSVVAAEQVSMALMVVMERMEPAERVAFVLHDVFGMPFADVAGSMDRSVEAVRALASRGRRRAREEGERHTVDAAAQQAVVEAFVGAVASGELAQVLRVLAPDVVFRTDGGGIVNAARHPLVGADRVARMLIALGHRRGAGVPVVRPITVNGMPGLYLESRGERSVMAFAVQDGLVTALDVMRNPEKLGTLAS